MIAKYMIQMPVEEFIELPRYWAQRDETKRMNKDHLKGELSNEDQLLVKVARLGDGSLVKVDGHSRALAWEKGQLEKPKVLDVIVYEGLSREQIDKLYEANTSKASAATPAEELQHARLLVGFDPTSKFCKSSWKAVLGYLNLSNQNELIAHYLEEFKTIDSWAIQSTRDSSLNTGIKAAMLKTLKSKPDMAVVFWKLYMDKDSSVLEINRLRGTVDQYKGQAGGQHVPGICFAQALGDFEAWSTKQ